MSGRAFARERELERELGVAAADLGEWRPDFDEELRAALATPSAPYPFLRAAGRRWHAVGDV
jgi:hypothetical protein